MTAAPFPHRYVVVEGPIGVGKTSLTRLLSERLGARTVHEDVSGNPFLPRYYKDMAKYAFQTQIFFLLARYEQQRALAQQNLFDRLVVSDYFFEKDRIFATVTLEEEEFNLYFQLYKLLNPKVPKPDLVIYLQARTGVLIERIRKRGRDFERGLEWNYLDAVNREYNRFFFQYRGSPLLVIDTSEIDFVASPSDLDDLIARVAEMKKGTVYYHPLGS
jgi:deoxyadenosine/deoxycytidine kinase